MTRDALLARLADRFDVLVIGGGATGLGAALDAASRGYAVALVEAGDFANATSSRSTKLVHGGVRYLQRGDVRLVREALHERSVLVRNAPHLVRRLGFLCPAYRRIDLVTFGAGLAAYDLLAGRDGFARSRRLAPGAALARFPRLRDEGLRGAIRYEDAQFDDARFALALARTAIACGAVAVSYARATSLLVAGGRVAGAVVRDEEGGGSVAVRARVVVNATGIFVDAVRSLDEPEAAPLLAFSRGTHLVFPRDLVPAHDALLVPRTADGRVLFAVPWLGATLVGTTDVAMERPEAAPAPTRDEADFIVTQLNAYLAQPVRRSDAVAAFAGVRPLVRGSAQRTAALSREHVVGVSPRGLVSVTGGKWTTYRVMAADAVDAAARVAGLTPVPCPTRTIALHGRPVESAAGPVPASAPPSECSDASTTRGAEPKTRHGSSGEAFDVRAAYGTDRAQLEALEREEPACRALLHPRLPYRVAEVVFALRAEYARTVEDILARRTRALDLDSGAAREIAPAVAALAARELGRDDAWVRAQCAAFDAVAALRAAAFR